MVVEILIKAHDNGNGWKTGFPVLCREYGPMWGPGESFPAFSLVRITDAPDLPSVQSYVTPWKRKTAYNILANDPSQDFFQVHIFADPSSIGLNAEAQFLAKDMSALLTSWGAKAIADATGGGVTFTIEALDALNATGYLNFGQEEEYVVFTQTAYDPTAGTHTISCDYSTSTVKPEQMTAALKQAQCDVVSRDDKNAKIVFNAHRSVMMQYLTDAVRKNFDTMIGNAQYYFPASVCTKGLTLMTFEEMKSCLIDIRTVK